MADITTFPIKTIVVNPLDMLNAATTATIKAGEAADSADAAEAAAAAVNTITVDDEMALAALDVLQWQGAIVADGLATYAFIAGNFSTQISVGDPRYIAPSSTPTGASGAWIRSRQPMTDYLSEADLADAIDAGSTGDLPQGATVLVAGEVLTKDNTRLWLPDVPGWKYPDQTLSGWARPPQGRATIQHKISASFGGIFYDVVTVTGGPHVVRKKLGPEATPANLGLTTRRTARNAARLFGVPVAFNADRASAPDGGFWTTSAYGIARGLQIADGIAYRDFQIGTSQDEAFVMMRDGTHHVARIADGKTAQQWVDEGALWTTGGFAFLVIDGVQQDVSADPYSVNISARTIFGRRANGDFVFLVVEGITGSYGIGGQDMVTLAVSEGMDIAIVLDGGGSSQCWWSNTYAVPSSDDTEVSPPDPLDRGRRVAGWLVVDVPSVDPYDSGVLPLSTVAAMGAGNIANLPPMWLHQVGPTITLTFNTAISPAFPNNADTALLTSPIRPRYFGAGTQAQVGLVRGNASGGGTLAFPVPTVATATGLMSVRTGTAGAPGPSVVSGLYGNYSWRARWS